jgi:hypothetical protein
MVPMTEAEGGPDMVSFRELARRLVADGIVESITHQRVSQISQRGPRELPAGRTHRTVESCGLPPRCAVLSDSGSLGPAGART